MLLLYIVLVNIDDNVHHEQHEIQHLQTTRGDLSETMCQIAGETGPDLSETARPDRSPCLTDRLSVRNDNLLLAPCSLPRVNLA